MDTRKEMSLDGVWRFEPDPNADGEDLGFFKSDYSTRLWREVKVPGCIHSGRPDLEHYAGIAWYRRSFVLPADWTGRRIVLQFQGVNYRARIWLNGICVGEHRDGFLPFAIDITESVDPSGNNILAVSVDNAHHEGDVPGMHVGWRGDGGILREVTLTATNALYVEDQRVVGMPAQQGGDVEVRVRLRNSGAAKVDGVAEISICDFEGNTCFEWPEQALALTANEHIEISLSGHLDKALAWSPSSPVLYRARACITLGDRVVDVRESVFGFRRIEAAAGGLLLNGDPIFLTGFNRHEDSPRTDMAVDHEMTRQDLQAMKEAGANFVRLCHYPHHPAALDMCDALGLLVLAEIPLYIWDDHDEAHRTTPARIKSASRQLECMITRDFNHPSVVFWSVSNETADEYPEVAQSNRELIRQARSLDSTRLCVHVSDRWRGHPNFEEDDVICINAYPSIDRRRPGHDPQTIDLGSSAESWRSGLKTLREQYPTKPILVTEFGYHSLQGSDGHSFAEDMHARVIETEFTAIAAEPSVCGATVWCWADHPWPPRRFWNGFGISPFGVVNRDRRELKPFWVAHKLFREKQGIKSPQKAAGDRSTSVIMIRPHMNDLPQFSFPDGFGIRPMTEDDIGLWTDIERDAEPYVSITDSLFRREFGHDLDAIQRRCFILTDPAGLGVGTVSAWYDRDFLGEDYGRIHWVAVRPSCQGKGLGKASLTYAMNVLSQWHTKSYLVTSAERLPAIQMYLDFGFVPHFQHAYAQALWDDIQLRLKSARMD